MSDQQQMVPSNGMAAFGQNAPPQPTALRPVAQNVYMTDFNDPNVKQYEFALYSGRTNMVDRICILEPGNIVRGRTHYHDKLKGGILCNSMYTLSADRRTETLAEERNCCKWLKAPQIRFAALLMHYGTDPRGQLVKPFSFELKLWRFGVDKYAQLRSINADFPLERFDLQVTCTDSNYQKMQIINKPECVFLHPDFDAAEKTRVRQWAQASLTKLPRELGRQFDNDGDLMKHLQEQGVFTAAPGQTPNMVPGPGASDGPIVNFSDILTTASSVQTGPATPIPGAGAPPPASQAPVDPAAPFNPFAGV